MSLKHIPKFVWLPVACLLWAFFALILVLALMSYRAKSLEIDLLNLAIKVQYVDQQLFIAQQNINTTMGVIDGLTRQLTQYQSSSPVIPANNSKQTVDTSVPANTWHPQSIAVSAPKASDQANQPALQQLEMQKAKLEGVSDQLKSVQDRLQSSVLKKYLH